MGEHQRPEPGTPHLGDGGPVPVCRQASMPGVAEPGREGALGSAARVSSAVQVAGSAAVGGELVPRWYAAYTSANHERRVAEQFAVRGIEHFLPQYESIRKWKDRKVRLQLPLFPGYIFVQLALQNRLRVLQVPGVARLVGFDGQPVAVPEEDLLRVREFLSRGFRAEPHRFLKVGRRVRVKAGPLIGMEGIVVRRKNGQKLVISFALIQQAMAVEVVAEDLEAL
jgi:transcription antitermination factor NusG